MCLFACSLVPFILTQNRALRMIEGAPPTTPALLMQVDLMCSSLEVRREIDAISQLHRIQALPWTSPLFQRLNHFVANSDSDTHKQDPRKFPHFFSQAYQLHYKIYNSPPLATWAKPLSPLQPPWILLPPPDQPSDLAQLKHELRLKVREGQNSEYSDSDQAEYFRKSCPDSSELWISDLRNFFLSRILFRLRSGHSKLAAHNRMLPNHSECPCGKLQTSEHLLLNCPLLQTARNELFSEVSALAKQHFKPSLTPKSYCSSPS